MSAPRIVIAVLDPIPFSEIDKLVALASRAFKCPPDDLMMHVPTAAKLGVPFAIVRIADIPRMDTVTVLGPPAPAPAVPLPPPPPLKALDAEPCQHPASKGQHSVYLANRKVTGHNDQYCQLCGAHGYGRANPLGVGFAPETDT